MPEAKPKVKAKLTLKIDCIECDEEHLFPLAAGEKTPEQEIDCTGFCEKTLTVPAIFVKAHKESAAGE